MTVLLLLAPARRCHPLPGFPGWGWCRVAEVIDGVVLEQLKAAARSALADARVDAETQGVTLDALHVELLTYRAIDSALAELTLARLSAGELTFDETVRLAARAAVV